MIEIKQEQGSKRRQRMGKPNQLSKDSGQKDSN